ncbi:Metallo-beta-lactamase family protein [Sulfitobacter noctilucicola]|uniref:Glyoxylase-like metal-dependent hydrolase (Beta-lactamase superfamily II) n=1 Tax=Sulfitobacter noctilucicola TaxID=1342301 RepID=A0A7W6Q6U0_9RHOB|nr:MBL fold metallo-hydrolase [Sulfitobacter noctilucicola]KIN63289.1 Metallo-beta-lactamase family protein [Sulfitobacter noctilucicola]MBB4175192.1 glyoxylase-like metal-dependent hydrolase (beta-lactamase superfamily II) [Sulfitobacter noctilucicola]
MSKPHTFTRRAALASAAALPLAAATATSTHASAPLQGAGTAPFQRVSVGGFDVTTILAGSRSVPDPQTIFGMNVDAETFGEVSAAAHLPTDAAQFFFTPTVVNTGAELVLFDTGLSADGTLAALQAAGYSADQVDIVVLTHMHGDHIGGLMQGDAPTFSNARYVTGQVEYDNWAKAENEGFDTKVKPLAEQMTFIGDGGSVASGITGMSAFGHTPGHMVYMIESDGKQLVLGADFANHYVWSLAHPDWEVKFDQDKEAAAKTRRRLLDMMAADGTPFVGYHMPWPAFGYVETAGDGFKYVPHSYQLLL